MTLQKKWVLLTAVGWILGFLAALALTPLANALTGKYLQQSPLPITMVIEIGIIQSILLRKFVAKSFKWLWIYLLSFTPCFIGIEMIADLITGSIN